MALYRKKPVVIEATRWYENGDHPEDGPPENEGLVVRRFNDPGRNGWDPCPRCELQMRDHGWVDTPEDWLIACPGDWIITGDKGERYPCKPDIFFTMYEPV